MSESKENNPLIRRVDALIRRQQEDSQSAVPLLTEVVEPAKATREMRKAEEALVEDIVRMLLLRLMPEVNKQIALLRAELEKELRKSAQEAVTRAVAQARKAKPGKT